MFILGFYSWAHLKEPHPHIGHFGQIADHGHTAAGIAIGIAGAIALIKILKDRKNISEVGDDEEIQEEIQEVS